MFSKTSFFCGNNVLYSTLVSYIHGHSAADSFRFGRKTVCKQKDDPVSFGL